MNELVAIEAGVRSARHCYERQLISTCLMLPEEIGEATSGLGVYTFADSRLDLIFWRLVDLRTQQRRIDPGEIAGYLSGTGELAEAGGTRYLLDLTQEDVRLPTRLLARCLVRPMVTTALYYWWDASDVLLYIGITDDLAARQTAHAKKSSWSEFAATCRIVRFPCRTEAEAVEAAAIRGNRPLFNGTHNDFPDTRERLVSYLVEKGRLDLLAPAVSRG